MGNRNVPFADGEHYHIYNQGVEKRNIFLDEHDFSRFLESISFFNQEESIGSIYEYSFGDKKKTNPLVDILAYCLNPNHYHFILKQRKERGIEKFMQRLGTGYSKYFNNKYDRRGSLFQGTFKSKHIDNNDYLLYISAYVNLNYEMHGLGSLTSKSSWSEYLKPETKEPFCEKGLILGQFTNPKEYELFAQEAISETARRRAEDKLLDSLLHE